MSTPNKTKIDLSRPVTISGASVSVLHMREPIVDDMIAVETKGTPAQKEVALFANLCEVEPAVIGGLSLKDYKKLKDAFESFTG